MATNHKPNVLVNGTDSNDKISNYPDYSGDKLTLSIKGGGKVIFEGISASDKFNINGIEHHINGKKLQ